MSQRMTIAGMLAFVAVMALVFASLRSASVVWTNVMATLTLIVFLRAALAAFMTRGAERSFWIGFAVFGWVYLILVNWDWIGGQFGHDLTGGLSEAAEYVIPPVTVVQTPPSLPAPGPVSQNPTITSFNVRAGAYIRSSTAPSATLDARMTQNLERNVKIGNFVEISRMGLSLLVAMVGGLMGRRLAAHGARE